MLAVGLAIGSVVVVACDGRRATAPTAPPARSSTALQPSAAPSVAPSPSATWRRPATATPAPTASPTPGPDPDRGADGHRPPPRELDGAWVDLDPLEDGPVADLVAPLQTALADRDADALAAMAADAGVAFAFLAPTEGSGVVPSDALAAALERLFDAGSAATVEGYFLEPEPGEDVDPPRAPIEAVEVAIDGWRGAFGFADALDPAYGMPLPEEATSTAIWRFESMAGRWRWTTWGWGPNGYVPTLESWLALHATADDGVTRRRYAVVRSRNDMAEGPPSVSTARVSPDGRWQAVVAEAGVVDAGDGIAGRWPMRRAIRVLDAAGNRVGSPIDRYFGDGFPAVYPAIVGWLDADRLVYDENLVGDGCGPVLWSGLRSFDAATGRRAWLTGRGQRLALDAEAWVAVLVEGHDEGALTLSRVDLLGGETTRAVVAAERIPLLALSPDGASAAVVTGFGSDGCAEERSGVVRVDWASGTVTELVPVGAGSRQVAWPAPDRIDVTYRAPGAWHEPGAVTPIDARTGAALPTAMATSTPGRLNTAEPLSFDAGALPAAGMETPMYYRRSPLPTLGAGTKEYSSTVPLGTPYPPVLP